MDIDELKLKISYQIKTRRKQLGLTQKQLADRIGCSKPWVTMMERQNPPLQLDTLLKVCSALECTLLEFFNILYGQTKFPEELIAEKIKQSVFEALSQEPIIADVHVFLSRSPQNGCKPSKKKK
jgi:transcriptional regulator with XRE-family HTH domain